MSLTDWLGRKFFGSYIQEIRRNIGSEIMEEMLKMVKGRAVYPVDSIENYISHGYLFNPVVYSIVSFIAGKAAAIPWGAYEIKDDKALRSYKSANSYNINTKIIKTKALIALPDHDLNKVFIKPNSIQGWSEFIEQVVGFKLITGNSYIHVIGPTGGVNAGSIRELWPIPSQIIRPVAGDKMQPIKGYKYMSSDDLIPPSEMLHLKYWTPEYFNGQNLIGLSPIRASMRLVTKSNASFDSSVGAFQNQGAFGIISAEKETDLTEEQADMIERRLMRKVGGPANRGKNIVTSASLKWQQMGMSPVDLNIIESDKMDLRSLCNVFRVPSELFNDASNKTYSNTKEAGSAVYTNAVLPVLNNLRDNLNQFILARYPGIYVDYDASMISELQDDLQMMASALKAVDFLTMNEKRDMLGFAADETNPLMNDYWIPSGLIPMSSASISDEELDETMKRLRIE